MNNDLLQDTIRRGLGRAAASVGAWCNAYRPKGPANPLDPTHRFLRLQAAFTSVHPSRPIGYGQPDWIGVFDAAYTRPGDYLVRSLSARGGDTGGVWFIASQQPNLPVLCVRASRVVSLARPAAPLATGVNTYGGVTLAAATALMTSWPASVLAAGGAGADGAALPADGSPGSWTVLLPAVPGIALRNGDLLTDDLGRTGLVTSAEQTDLGWRLIVKQATT